MTDSSVCAHLHMYLEILCVLLWVMLTHINRLLKQCLVSNPDFFRLSQSLTEPGAQGICRLPGFAVWPPPAAWP